MNLARECDLSLTVYSAKLANNSEKNVTEFHQKSTFEISIFARRGDSSVE